MLDMWMKQCDEACLHSTVTWISHLVSCPPTRPSSWKSISTKLILSGSILDKRNMCPKFQVGSQMPQLRAMWQRSREKEQKQQHINGTENILLKGCNYNSVRYYNRKSSGSLKAALHGIPYVLVDS
ncbi:hypothetical protein TNCV_4461481 [Trichonephila clavipes]|nr:hypothetical protein TNCV_4461481 [Trichonephila clavipes]